MAKLQIPAHQSRSRMRGTVARRALCLALAALLCLGCVVASGCSGSTFARLGGLIGNGPSSFGATFTAADRGPRPSVTPEARDHFVDTANAKSATVLVYMVGSDLESEEGDATADLQEMCAATLGSNVRLLVQAGGCTDWQNDVMVSGNGRYEIANGQVRLISDLGNFDSLTTSALADFISWGAKYAPANRYELIMWDHGGGTFDGFGYDEYYEESVLTLGDIASALERSHVTLDFIGFDSCLMGTIETAYAAHEYADYLIASEETEVDTGWYYTNWLNTLAQKPSIDTEELGRIIVDDFVTKASSSFFYESDATLSVVDLAKIDWLYGMLGDYLGSAVNTLSDDYATASAARANAKEFGEGEYDQIDMVDYLDRIATDDAGRVAAAVESTVAYTASSSDVQGANGLAMYYPYTYLAYYSEIASDLKSFGYAGSVAKYFETFVNLKEQRGGAATSSSSSGGLFGLLGSLLGGGSESTLADSADRDNVLTLTDKGDYYALKLTDAQWETVVYAELWAYLDDGEGFVDLGADNTYEFDDDGDLIVDFDNRWLTIESQIVPYYTEGVNGDDDDWYEYGYVPAELNGRTDIDIMIYFDATHTTGEVVGYRLSNDGKPQVQGRGYKQFKRGDTIDFVCDYYDYNGNYADSYYYGERVTYDGKLSVGRKSLAGETVDICYMLQDVYGDEYYTEYVEFSK